MDEVRHPQIRGRRKSRDQSRVHPYLPRERVRVVTVSEGGGSVQVMVGPVRGPEHLELIRRAGYYHVPTSAIAASRTVVAYIALYEGATRFRGQVGVIREYAAVLRVSRVRRAELPGLTWPGRRGEDAVYYRFDLGPLQRLPRPITNPDRLRVVFRFPELAKFRGAATLRDLGAGGSRTPRAGSAKRRPGLHRRRVKR
jgi:hypothetical protein